MRVHDKAIVLQSLRHGERQHILKLYSRSHGLLSMIAGAGKSPSSKIKPALLLPLTLLDVNFTLRGNRELHRLSEASCYYVHERIATSFVRLSIAQFLNELLIKSLKEQQHSESVFDFVEASLNYLNDSDRHLENLPIYFLRELSRHLGFEPNANYSSQNKYFDLREGSFNSVPLVFPLGLNAEESLVFSEHLKEDLLRAEVPKKGRQWLLDLWLAYYRQHVPGFNEMKSVEVLRELRQ